MTSVGVRCTAVPDGIAAVKREAGKVHVKLRLSLMLSPTEEFPGGERFALSSWCKAVEQMTFAVDFVDGNGNATGAGGLRDRYDARDQGLSKAQRARLEQGRTDLFFKMFGDGDPQFAGLSEGLRSADRPIADPHGKKDFLVSSGGGVIDPRKVRFAPVGRIAREMCDVVCSEAARSLFLAAVAPDKKARKALRRQLAASRPAGVDGDRARKVERRLEYPDDKFDRVRRWTELNHVLRPEPAQARSAALHGASASENGLDAFFNRRQTMLISKAEDLYKRSPGLLDAIADAAEDLLPGEDFGWSPLSVDPGSHVGVPQTNDRTAVLEDLLKLPGNSREGRALNLAVDYKALALRAFDDERAQAPFQKDVDLDRSLFDEDPATCEEDPAQRARRRLAELHAHPTLMRFLHFMVDVDVELTTDTLQKAADGRFYGLVRARPSRFQAGPDIHTAFVLDLARDQLVFEPCPEHAWPDRASQSELLRQVFPIEDGLVDLRISAPVQGHGGDHGRFRLETVDANAALNAIRSQAQATTDEAEAGSPMSSVATGSPELRSRGIALLDQGADAAHTMSLMKTIFRETAGDASEPMFAEDLTAGFRLDIVHDGALPRAYSACARDLVYPEINRAYGKPDEAPRPGTAPEKSWRRLWHPYPELADRDDGFIQPTAREKEEPPVKDETSSPQVFPSETVVTYAGYNIGMPSESTETAGDVGATCADDSLPVTVHYRLPRGRPGPSLRTGRPFRVMLRTRKINGSSVTARDSERAIRRYAIGTGEVTDVRVPDRSFWFKRPERISAPSVLLREDDPLLRRSAKEAPGESDTSVTLRDGQSRSVQRVIVAPRTDFDSCEQAGLFDGHPERCRGVYRRQLDANGAFPPATRQGTDLAETVGQLFSRGKSTTVNPYFADPAGRQLSSRVRLPDGRELYWLSHLDLPAFWDDSPDDDGVKPIVLEIASAGKGQRGRLAVDRTNLPGLGPAWRLVATIPEADEVELELWPFIDPAERSKRLILSDAWMRAEAYANRLLGGELFEQRVREAAARKPLDELVGTRVLRLKHAVRRPLLVPEFVFSAGRPLRLIRQGDGTSDEWPSFVANCLERMPSTDKCRLPAEGTLSYLAGQLRVHRPSTGVVRCEAAWLDFNPATARRPVSPKDRETPTWYAPEGEAKFVYSPRVRFDDLFELRDLPRQDRMADQGIVDLVRNEAGQLRSLVASFDTKDGKARRLALRLVGTSRFVHDYPAEPPERTEELFGAAGATREQIVETLHPVNGRPSLRTPVVWLDASVRPRPPRITRVETMIPTGVARPSPGSVEVLRRVTSRLNLGAEWFDSGEGEMLGIVCVPGDLVDDDRPARRADLGGRYPAAEFRATPEESWRRRSLDWPTADEWWSSHWGMDPTTLTQSLVPNVIPPEALSGYAWKLARQVLWARLSENAAYEPHDVSLFLFEPRFDRSTGEWFVDLDVNTGIVKSPFMRLVLVRYQPHAIHDDQKDFRLSEPLVLDDFKLYSPCRVNVERGLHSLRVDVHAPTFTERAPAMFSLPESRRARGTEIVRRAQAPNYQVEVAVRQPDGRTALLYGDDCRPLKARIDEPEPGATAGYSVWRTEIPLPSLSDRSELLVTVEEHEAHVDSRAVFDPAFAGEDIECIIKSPTPVSVVV